MAGQQQRMRLVMVTENDRGGRLTEMSGACNGGRPASVARGGNGVRFQDSFF